MARPDTTGPSTKTHARVRLEVPDWSTRRGLVGPLPERSARGPVAVLVVDSDHGPWSPVADILRAAGYTVVEACRGEDASRMVDHLRFAAIVVDAGTTGLPAACLTGDGDPPPVVVLAEVQDEGGADGTGSRGAVARLRKPVSPAELVSAVARVVADDTR